MATDVVSKENRTLPHNAEAERTVLGAVLVDNQAFNSAAEILSRNDFYREAHRRVFDAMAALAERSQAIDLVTLKDELVREVEDVGDDGDVHRALAQDDVDVAERRRVRRRGDGHRQRAQDGQRQSRHRRRS